MRIIQSIILFSICLFEICVHASSGKYIFKIKFQVDFSPISDSTQKTVLVTGGAGFIGSHVAAALLARGDRVVIIDEVNNYYDVSVKNSNLKRLEDKFPPEQLAIYRGDICDWNLTRRIFEKEKLTHVCHLAARAGVRPSIQDPYIYVHSNVEGTTRLLDLSSQFKITNFVYASSSSVYGKSDNPVFSETDIVDKPISPYAATKKST
jgi:UDP-glucuronate 4-epimerase